MSIGDHPGSPCQDVCNYFPWWLCDNTILCRGAEHEFQGLYYLTNI